MESTWRVEYDDHVSALESDDGVQFLEEEKIDNAQLETSNDNAREIANNDEAGKSNILQSPQLIPKPPDIREGETVTTNPSYAIPKLSPNSNVTIATVNPTKKNKGAEVPGKNLSAPSDVGHTIAKENISRAIIPKPVTNQMVQQTGKIEDEGNADRTGRDMDEESTP